MFTKIVDVTQVVVLVITGIFVVAMFAVGQDDGGGGGDEAAETGPASGEEIFTGNCASCHGADGGGGVGPAVAGGAVVEAYPEIEDEIAVITDGRGGMPAFGGPLSPEEIRAVAEYTRTL